MVPNGWEITNFGQLAEFRNGLNFTKADRGEAIKIVGVADFKDHSSLSSFERLDTINVSNTVKENDLIKSGDVLFVRSNGNKDLIGRCLFFPEVTEKLSFSGFTIRGRVTSKDILPSYLALLSRSEIVKQQFSKNGGGTNISNLSQQILNDVVVPLPTIKEQRKIAQILSTWDRGIATTEKLIDVSKQQKKALMQHLLTGKKRLIDPETGKAFEREWKTIKIKDVFKAKTTRAKDSNYTTYSVTKNGIVSQENYFNKSVASQDTSNYKVIEFGDFVMSGLNFWMGSVDIYLNKTKGIISPAYKTFSVSNDVDLKFMYQFVRSDKFNQILVDSSIVGASVVRRNFNSDVFFNWGIGLPSMREQQKISSVLTAADNEIEFLETKLAHLKLEKKALMQQLLTGKRRVKV